MGKVRDNLLLDGSKNVVFTSYFNVDGHSVAKHLATEYTQGNN
jgi:hypothetical protein